MQNIVKHMLEADLKPSKGILAKDIITLAEERLDSGYAQSSVRIAAANESVLCGVRAACNNCETMVQNGANLINTRPLVEYFRDFIAKKTATPRNKNYWDLLAACLGRLCKPLAQVSSKDEETILELAKQARENPEQVTFQPIVDIILEHWDVLCSCDDTYVVLAVMAAISEPQNGDCREDFMALMQALEVSSLDWPG